MTRVIRRERLHAVDPKYGRHVHHDSESLRYPFDTTGITIKSVRWQRQVPVFDQKNLGSCTGNAGLGCLGTNPFFSTVFGETVYPFGEPGAIKVYSDATKIDDAPGQYPPTDTGSDGLSVAKVLQKAGLISGYQHTFTLDDALKALQVVPLIVGTEFLADMETPDAEGIVSVSGAVLGGHEYVLDEYDETRGLAGFSNSWSAGWGLDGRFYVPAEQFGDLLKKQGDVVAFTPNTQPAPQPTPDPAESTDEVFAQQLHAWLNTHPRNNKQVQSAAETWLVKKDL
jgi:hypothetical protein